MTRLFARTARGPRLGDGDRPVPLPALRTPENDGYTAVQLGFGRKPRLNKPARGHLKAGLPSVKSAARVPSPTVDDLEVGRARRCHMFAQGEIVDVIGTSKGRGFAGVMKRHNFPAGRRRTAIGPPAQPGSVGSGTTPGASSRTCAWPVTWATRE